MTADLHHLAAAYALDALDDVERQAFEAHYPSCEICSSEVNDFRDVAGSLARSTATVAPPALKASVLAEIAQTRQLSPLVSSRSQKAVGLSRRMLFAAAAALVLIGGVLVVALPGSEDDRYNDVASSADRVVTTLDALTEGQTGSLQIIWSDDRDQVAVVGSRLADPGDDKAYALWFLLDDGGVAPAGLFRPKDGSVSEVLDIDDLDTTGWGITIEPAEGSAQPTTDVIFAGTL